MLLVVKAVVAGGALWAVATPLRVAVTAGIGLAQVGEFSFILGRSGLKSGSSPSRQWQVLLAASISTMIVTPRPVQWRLMLRESATWISEKTKRGSAELPERTE